MLRAAHPRSPSWLAARRAFPQRVARAGLACALAISFAFTGAARVVRADEPPPPPNAPPPNAPPPNAPPPNAPPPNAAPPMGAAVERLAPAELEILRRRFPDWDRMDLAARRRVAANVLRLRALSPEDRARLLDRARRLERSGVAAAFPDRLDALRGLGEGQKERAREGHLVLRAVARAVMRGLPDDARAAIGIGAAGEPLRGGAALEPGERGSLERATLEAFKRRVAEGFTANPPLEPPAARERATPGGPPDGDGLERLREEVLRQGGADAPLPLRQRYARGVAVERLRAAIDVARPPGENGVEARVAAATAALKAAFPAAFEDVGRDLVAAAARGRDGLLEFSVRQLPDRGPGGRLRAIVDLWSTLERARPALAGSADLAAHAEALQRAILADVKLSDEDAARIREGKTPADRVRALNELLRKRRRAEALEGGK